MYWSLRLSYALTLLLAIPAGALLVRVFIVQHDCGHGSFFASRRANDLLGMVCSMITFTPYENWRRQHAGHHANWNNLDKRTSGADIYSACLTVREYRKLTRWQKIGYRLSRHPLVAHVVFPPLVFLLLYRIPFDTPKGWHRERLTVYWTDLALFVVLGGLGLIVGFKALALVQLPVLAVSSIIGVGLFAVQHRFDDALWARQPEWRFGNAALLGSSYLKLPRLLQWFTGNIGFHNVHHLAPRIPNYRLESCYRANPEFAESPSLTLGEAFRAIRLALWDEDRGQMVGFREMSRR
ncbi:MAG TPA: fatty acid desaturase [Micropepsaceae bacterium]|jgi:omega-6 fatty acid desaturase (delta-12 desaturase)|nr:fatty acid desaturase [Micropepsaceae bacterium]